MKISCVMLFCAVLFAESHANAQNRKFRVGSLELDNGDANVLTLTYSGIGNATFSIPTGGGTFVPTGTVDSQLLIWNQTGSAWQTLSVVPISAGGTNANTAAGAAANLLPSQTNQSGKVLTNNGAGTLSWVKRGSMLIAGNSGSNLINGNYIGPMGIYQGATEFPIIVTRNGTLKNFYVSLTAAPGLPWTRYFEVVVNGIGTDLIVYILGDSVASHNLGDTVAVTAGDRISIYHTTDDNSTPASAAVSLELEY